MNSMVTCSQSELAHPAVRATRVGVRPAWLANYRLREIAGDVALLVAVLAFVLTFVALRMTLFAPADVIERVAIPLAAGAAVICVLAFLGSLLLRYSGAPGPRR
jgi:hypothetical protein